MNQLKAKKAIESFLLEDLGEQDLSSSIFDKDAEGVGTFVAKSDGVLSGVQIIEWAYQLLGGNFSVKYGKKDGDSLKKGDIIATVKGSIPTLLMGERVILNLMQRMSGIATLTKRAVDQLNSGVTQIADTRKTMPGLRQFDKYAVTCGGGKNHRFGLYDAVMLKDNHIAYAGSIEKAVAAARAKVGHTVKIEVETETEAQVVEAVKAGADIIMLDNCPPEVIKERIKLIPASIITEASGGITLDNLHTFKDSGVGYISLGCLTHSVMALDISFNLEGGTKTWTY
ncbi:MAG: carboxylating nicotinate-nucleotide diphosphorylase [Turicibacter sp.]|nr:carboxylating nicotinate-nucleotide diphosphorylase [Turicibacter sp.]